MRLSRKQFLRAAAAIGAAVPLAGCEHITTEITHRLGDQIPKSLSVPSSDSIDPMFHLLSRAGFGPRPGELERARELGAQRWLEEQLHPEKIDDSLSAWHTSRFETLHLDPGTCYEYKKPVLRDEMTRHSVLSAVYSKRQLFETAVEFWGDHLNIYIEKGDCMYLKPSDDQHVVRAHALGKFRDLIRASATSPAMLVYLDGNQNRVDKTHEIPNENYARELLELHTLGVHGGYTQNDVYEVGRCLTGWRLHEPWQRAKVYFDEDRHDDGEKHVLGQVIPAGGGAGDIERVVDIACGHPSTAQHIATKLVTRYVAEDPPAKLVQTVAEKFSSSKGDIRDTFRTLLTSDQFQQSKGSKFKRPMRFVISCLRMTGADTFAHTDVLEYLTRMGQPPFQHPTPDGYSDHAHHWANALLWRWNFALALTANKINGAKVPLDTLLAAITTQSDSNEHKEASEKNPLSTSVFGYLVGRAPTREELAALQTYTSKVATNVIDNPDNRAGLFGLILASPAFQRY
jgi:uncharacterized protein (DUF1800 family)